VTSHTAASGLPLLLVLLLENQHEATGKNIQQKMCMAATAFYSVIVVQWNETQGNKVPILCGQKLNSYIHDNKTWSRMHKTFTSRTACL